MRHLIAAAALLVSAAAPAQVDVKIDVVGLFPGKAVIVVDRGAPRTFAVGQAIAEGVKLVAVDSQGAVVEIEGRRQRIEMGRHFATSEASGQRTSVTLAADASGHFVADGTVNGGHIRFLVDTGATNVFLPASEARRLQLDYRSGKRAMSMTANGPAEVYLVKLATVTVGDLTLLNVEGVVGEGQGMGMALLGMSFLNRTEMRREGGTLTLTKRY